MENIDNDHKSFKEEFFDSIELGRNPDFKIPPEDIKILQELGRQKAEYANDPANQVNAILLRNTNDLQMTKPPVFIDEICCNEMNVDD